MTFVEYVGFYGLSRSEGLVLRYLADAYKALRQTVPEDARTEELTDLIEWLGELVRQVDSSLLDEWERLRNPDAERRGRRGATTGRRRSPRNVRAFRVLVRNALFRRVELAALRRYDELGELDGAAGWDADAWADGAGGLLRRVRRARHRPGRPRSGAAAIIEQQPDRWRSARSSTTRPATTTGASAPRSTSPRPTRRAPPRSASPPSDRCPTVSGDRARCAAPPGTPPGG